MRFLALALVLMAFAGRMAAAAPADAIADALVEAAAKPITPDSLPTDFARLTKFVRHDANGMVLFTDGGSTDGYVRHAQAQFDMAAPARGATDKMPLFAVAFELVDQADFTFEGLSSGLEQRLGTPDLSSNRTGAAFRTWLLKQPAGRTLTVARAQASDNGDPITIIQIIQDR